MEKKDYEDILKLIDLKIQLAKWEDIYNREIEKCVDEGSYYFAEGGETEASREVERISNEIKEQTNG